MVGLTRIPLQRITYLVREHTIGMCLPHSVVLNQTLRHLGEPSVIMVIGNNAHYYVHSKSFGPIDIYPEGFRGELKGICVDQKWYEPLIEIHRLTVDEVIAKLKQTEGGT